MKSSIGRFFLFCAGADHNILKRTPTDVIKYSGIGATIFFTGILAFIAAAYAIYTVFESYLVSILFGLIWGLMIFNLDRYIVSSMKNRGSFWRDFLTALPRLGLAALIAIVIAKPLELKIFESEIQSELLVMEQEKFKIQEDKVKVRFYPQIDVLKDEVKLLKDEIELRKEDRDRLASLALQEADGTGGSMQRNLGPIYRAKKTDADNAQYEFEQTMANNEPLIETKEAAVAGLEQQISNEIQLLQRAPLNGFASRLDALGRLSQQSQTILWASLFITLLFIAIETAPIFVKLISSRSPYDLVLHKHEHRFEMNHKERTTVLANAVHNKIQFDTETGQYKTQLATRAEKQIAEHLIKEELEKLKQQPIVWKDLLRKGKLFGTE